MNFELPHKPRILSISSDDYIFDNYLDLLSAEIDVDLWTYRTLQYDPDNLPTKVNILRDDKLPLSANYDLVLAHNAVGIQVGRQLADIFHLPLVLWKHNHLRCRSFMEVSSFNANCMQVMSAVTDVTNTSADIILARAEAPSPVDNSQAIFANFDKRMLQYSTAKCLVNRVADRHCPEIDECLMLGIPVFTVPNVYHAADLVHIFTSLDELSVLLTNNHAAKSIPKSTVESFVSDITYLCSLTKGYNHVSP